MAKWADLGNELRTKLWLKTLPIGFKRFENPDDLDKIPDLQHPEHFFVFCQLIAKARKLGLTVGSKTTYPCYTHCGRIHGVKPIPPGWDTPEDELYIGFVDQMNEHREMLLAVTLLIYALYRVRASRRWLEGELVLSGGESGSVAGPATQGARR